MGSIILSTSCTILSSHLQISFFSLCGFEYLVVWDDLSAVGVCFVGSLHRASCQRAAVLLSHPHPIPTHLHVNCTILLSYQSSWRRGVLNYFHQEPTTVFSAENAHNSLIDGKIYWLLSCNVQQDTSGIIFFPFRLRGWLADLLSVKRQSDHCVLALFSPTAFPFLVFF